jgi:hypothetical protein
MADRDKLSDADADDWFAEPEPTPVRRVRSAESVPLDEALTEERVLPPADDWLASAPPSRVRRPSWASGSTRKAVAVGGILIVVLLASLAAAGVFSSSGGKHSTAGTTTVRTSTTPTTTPAAVQPPTTTLKPGDTGAQVRALQRVLTQLGYSTGKIDGSYGPATKTAVSKFQQAHQLTADGIVGPATLAALRRATAP